MSANERTGWRDINLSLRHREWGIDVPATDIDLFVEYDHAIPRGLAEYKNERATTQHSTHPNYRALIRLAAGGDPIPLWAARYPDDLSTFTVTALNEECRNLIPSSVTMTEEEYVSFLYEIRGRTKP